MEILHAIADVNAESIIIEKPLGRPMEGAAKCKSNSAPNGPKSQRKSLKDDNDLCRATEADQAFTLIN